MKKNIFGILLLFFSNCYSLSSIPQYEIDSIIGSNIILNNSSSFNVIEPLLVYLGWEIGDKIEIKSSENYFPPSVLSYKDGQLVNSCILLSNVSKNNQTLTLMEVLPTPEADTPQISSIDLVNNLIYLDNLSIWNFLSEDRDTISNWAANDIIMIGKNKNFSTINDAIFFNVSKSSTIPIYQSH